MTPTLTLPAGSLSETTLNGILSGDPDFLKGQAEKLAERFYRHGVKPEVLVTLDMAPGNEDFAKYLRDSLDSLCKRDSPTQIFSPKAYGYGQDSVMVFTPDEAEAIKYKPTLVVLKHIEKGEVTARNLLDAVFRVSGELAPYAVATLVNASGQDDFFATLEKLRFKIFSAFDIKYTPTDT